MPETTTKSILDVLAILKEIKALIMSQNSYLPVYSALCGAFVGAVSTFIPTTIIDHFKTRKEKKALTLALYSEISAILRIISIRNYVKNIKTIIQKFESKSISEDTFIIIIPDDYALVFKKNISRIGIINPLLQIDIVTFYQLFEAVIQDVKPGGMLNNSPKGFDVFKEVLSITEQMINCGKKIVEQIENLYPNISNANKKL